MVLRNRSGLSYWLIIYFPNYLIHPFTKWTVNVRRSSLHVPASVVNIPVGYIGSPEVWHGNVDAMMDTSIKFVKEKACASDGYIWK